MTRFQNYIVLLSTFLFSPLLAQTDSVLFLQNIIVESSRLNSNASETGRNVIIIPSPDLAKYPINSIDDILRYLPNLEVQTRGPFGSQADISIRGTTFNQVLMMIDGVRLNAPLTGHFNHHIPIALSEIKQLEIIKGGTSALFGPDAVGGVVNIVTKTFTDQQDAKTLELVGNAQYGAENLLFTNLAGRYKQNGWQLSATGSYNNTDGQMLSNITRSFFERRAFGVAVRHKFSKTTLAWRSNFDERFFNAQFFYTASTFDQSKERVKRFWNQGQIAHTFNAQHKTVFDFAYQENSDHFDFNPAITRPNEHTTQYLNAQFNHYWTLKSNLKFTFGGQLDNRKIESSDRGNHVSQRYGLYVVGQYSKNRIVINSGLRFEEDAGFGTEFLPYFNVRYSLGDFALRAAAGRNIRAADFTERFVSNNLSTLAPGRNLGNPNLEAEKTWSFEVGLDYIFKSLPLKFATTLFRRSSTNLIDFVLTNASNIANASNLTANADYLYARNISEVETSGAEAQIQTYWNLNKHKFDLNIGYTWLNSSSSARLISKYISNHARHLLTWNLVWQIAKFRLSLNGIFKQRNPETALSIRKELSEQYTVYNLRANYQLIEQLGLNLQINNILDVEYADVLGAQLPKRWIMVGVNFRFVKD